MTLWTALRRPLLVALFFGCAISLMDAGSLTLRLVLPATVYWTFVPAVEILGLFAASSTARHAGSRLKTIDRFFMGHGVWLLWLIGYSAYWAFIPGITAFSWFGRNQLWLASAALAAAWSAVVDFRFFRTVLKCTPWQAGRELAVQRLVSWTAGLGIFLGSSAMQVVTSRLGL